MKFPPYIVFDVQPSFFHVFKNFEFQTFQKFSKLTPSNQKNNLPSYGYNHNYNPLNFSI